MSGISALAFPGGAVVEFSFGVVSSPVLSKERLHRLPLERGYSYFYSLDLTYTLAEPDNVFATGVNAKTGEIVIEGRYGESESIVYSDLNGYAGREKLEALAEYGIGWRGEKCVPQYSPRNASTVSRALSLEMEAVLSLL